MHRSSVRLEHGSIGDEVASSNLAGAIMIPRIIPLGQSKMDWNTFLAASETGLGYSPLRGVDALSRELSDPAKFIAALACFRDKQNLRQPLASIRDATSVLHHFSYSFLVYCKPDLILDIRERSTLHITSSEALDGERLAVLSGTLGQYQTAITENSTPDSPFNIRHLSTALLKHFESEGLQDLFYDYRKRPQKDGTLLLEYKP